MLYYLVSERITAGYFHQAVRVKSIGESVNIWTGPLTHLHPTNARYGLGCKYPLHYPDATELTFV